MMKKNKIYCIIVIISLCCLFGLWMKKEKQTDTNTERLPKTDTNTELLPKTDTNTERLPKGDTSVNRLTNEDYISESQALEIAHSAIAGYENYDKTGKIVIELKENRYYVTFPHGIPEDSGKLMPDYAVQVCIDAKSGKVLETRVGS